MRSTDAVVVGAGVIGASTAYYLARAGVDTVLIDRCHVPAGATASSASAGGVRQQGRVAAEMPVAIESIRMWPALEDELAMDLHYRRGGMAICTDQSAGAVALRARVERERSLGLEDVRFVDGDELRRLVPGIAPRILGASYCPTDGQADPMRTTRAFSLAAERHGARVLWRCGLTGLRRDGGRATAVDTSEGPIGCRVAVLAAGAWTPALAERCGFPLPMIRPGFLQMLSTGRFSPLLGQVLGWVGQGISLKQAPAGTFVIGGGWPGRGTPDRYETHALPGSIAKSAATATALFPILATAPLLRAWVGIESFSRDDYPVVSEVPAQPGVIVAAGFSGHGFAIAPGIGRRIAEWISTGRRPEILAPFDLARFEKEPAAHA